MISIRTSKRDRAGQIRLSGNVSLVKKIRVRGIWYAFGIKLISLLHDCPRRRNRTLLFFSYCKRKQMIKVYCIISSLLFLKFQIICKNYLPSSSWSTLLLVTKSYRKSERGKSSWHQIFCAGTDRRF